MSFQRALLPAYQGQDIKVSSSPNASSDPGEGWESLKNVFHVPDREG